MQTAALADVDREERVLGADTWDFKGSDTRYGVHGIHTYVAAMIPQLARRLIDMHIPDGGVVLDPFCGGGAVLAEAVLSNRYAIGRDVNELAILISRAKTTHVQCDAAETMLHRVLDSIGRPESLPEIDKNVAYWFKPEQLPILFSLRDAIKRAIDVDHAMRPLFLAAFSATVRDVSLTYRNEIRLRRMNKKEIDSFNVDPLKRFEARITRATHAVSQLPASNSSDIQIGSAQLIDLPAKSVSGIVCSPPYGDERNGVSYTQFSKNMLALIGHSMHAIRESKAESLGWGRAERELPKSETLEAAIDQIAEYPDSIREAIAFYGDYQVALGEMVRVSSGPIVIVIGRRVLRDTVFDNGGITIDLMRNAGAKLTARYFRTLPSKRLPRMRNFGAAINQEDILVFES